MKELVKGNIGGDGAFGSLSIDKGNLVGQVGIPMAKVLEPIKKNFVDKLKAMIPGTWDDVLIDQAWSEAVDFLSEKSSQP